MAGAVVRIWPRATQTLALMIEHGIIVKACCGTCRTFFKVDLALLRSHFGPHYSLINKRGKCPILNCHGSCAFLYTTSEGTPMRVLAD
jgi:hypothetical protein